MKNLLVYLKNYKKETVLAPLFKLLEAVFELFVPLVIANIIDVGIPNRDTGYIGKMFGLLVALAIIGLTCSITAQFFAAKAATGVSTRIRSALFAHIQHLSFKQIDENTTATLITRMTSDINQVQSGINMVLRLFLRSPIIVFGAMIMAFTIDVKSAFIFVVSIPVLAIIVMSIILGTIPMHKAVQSALDGVLGATRENLSGARVIRAFRREDDEIDSFNARTGKLFALQNKVGRITGVLNPATLVVVNVAIVVLVYTGAVQVDTGILTKGQVVALWNYMSQILVELVKLANLIVTITKAVACGDRIWSVLGVTPEENQEISDKNDRIEDKNAHVIEFRNVGLTYSEGAEPALSNISFTVDKGETVGIIGGTGSGKSSLVNMLPGFYQATEGQILFYGKDINDYGKEYIRSHVSIAMQKATLFAGTIRSNLLMGKNDATEEELMRAVEIAQALDVVKEKGGLDAGVAQGGKDYSGGQKQRLALARTLVAGSEVLILDDSASALDFATEAALREALKREEKETTVFIVSQRTSSIIHADKIIVLDDGCAVGVGSHEELLKNCDVYREIYLSQFPERAGEING